VALTRNFVMATVVNFGTAFPDINLRFALKHTAAVSQCHRVEIEGAVEGSNLGLCQRFLGGIVKNLHTLSRVAER
jgi:hypothetical protein